MRFIVFVFLICTSVGLFSQADSTRIDKKKKDRYVARLIPSAAPNIFGIAIGLIGSETICNRPYTKKSHGLNIQIFGQGFLQIFYINKVKFKDLLKYDTANINKPDTIPKKAVHNGVLVSLFGTFTDQVNGVSFSGWMSMGRKINGLSVNLLWNFYNKINGASIGVVNHAGITKGIQIGIVNKSVKLKGLQFGIWNKTERRSFPIINWGFKDKKLKNKNKAHNYQARQ